MKYVLGIDTGLHGAMALTDKTGFVHEVFDMPVTHETINDKVVHAYDLDSLITFLKRMKKLGVYVFIEKTYPIPGRSGKASWLLGGSYMMLIGMLYMGKICYTVVDPRTWQAAMLGSTPKGETKKKSHEIALTLATNTIELETKRGRIFDGRCDSILIAEYGRRKLWLSA